MSSVSGQLRRIVAVGGPAAVARFSVETRRATTHDQARIPASRCTLAS